jgi:hypothetical protein
MLGTALVEAVADARFWSGYHASPKLSDNFYQPDDVLVEFLKVVCWNPIHKDRFGRRLAEPRADRGTSSPLVQHRIEDRLVRQARRPCSPSRLLNQGELLRPCRSPVRDCLHRRIVPSDSTGSIRICRDQRASFRRVPAPDISFTAGDFCWNRHLLRDLVLAFTYDAL